MTYQLIAFRAMAVAIALAAPSIAMAQDSTTTNQGGPMVVEQVTQRYAIAPEVKFTDLGNKSGVLIGGHGGMLVGHNVLVGAGFYTLANGSHGSGLTYGGGTVDWQWWNNGLVSGSVGSLLGLGHGTTVQDLTFTDRAGRSFSNPRLFASDFFVAEPHADLLVRLTKHLHLDVGAGYRFTSADHGQRDHFSGASGGLALRIGPAQ